MIIYIYALGGPIQPKFRGNQWLAYKRAENKIVREGRVCPDDRIDEMVERELEERVNTKT